MEASPMRAKLIGLLIGLGLAAAVAPALACPYGNQTASSDQTSTQQTADSRGQTGAN